ncbi:MAG: sulfatase [Verrucomicrobiota bacterium]|nr:sulfatase [Verrucomicrobiota bacterium]
MKRLLLILVFTTIGQALILAKSYNVLVIQTDEHHFKTLGCYGGKIVSTPNIDWIAKKGALATSFYATTPVCSPSRGSLISGLYPQHTPVTNNNIPLGDHVVTFAEVLRRKGYKTGYAGKWHLDGFGKPQWAPERKFGFDDNRYMFNRGHWKKFEITGDGPHVAAIKQGKPSYGVENANNKSFSTDWLADRTIDFINANKVKPFCYMVSFPDPHGPNTVRKPYDTMFKKVNVPVPVSVNKSLSQTPRWGAASPKITADTVRLLMPKYYGMIKCLDDNIGRILDTLRKNGQIERTIIVFTSDHGDLCGEHGRLNKGVPYEGSARIPFLFYYPGKIPAGTVVNQALSCVDFVPTLFALTGDKLPKGVEGRDASTLFQGNKDQWEDIAFIRSTSTGKPWLAAVTDRHKLIYSGLGDPWLYDLQNDPHELQNAINNPKSKKIVQQLTSKLATYAKRHDDPYADNEQIKADMTQALGQAE